MNQVRLQAETKIAAKRTRADTLRQRIADEILVGKLPPGTRLEEQDLADRFGVSRTPVREALKALVETGLVDIRPHRGAVVATPSRQHMRDLFEVMRELEAICARYAAQRMTSAERKKRADRADGKTIAAARAGSGIDHRQGPPAQHGPQSQRTRLARIGAGAARHPACGQTGASDHGQHGGGGGWSAIRWRCGAAARAGKKGAAGENPRHDSASWKRCPPTIGGTVYARVRPFRQGSLDFGQQDHKSRMVIRLSRSDMT